MTSGLKEGARLLLAQVGAETRTRLRSAGTLVTILAVIAGSYAWLPAPNPYSAALTWGPENGLLISGIYNSAYVGTASALLVTTLLPLLGFYLVAGSVSRDRRSGVGAILAASPLSSLTYLTGKVIAHTAYLHLVAASSFLSGLVILFRHREGSLEPLPFILPWLLLVPPALLITAAIAVLFDVTPGLRSRGGLVIWFFVWAFCLLVVPMMHIEERRPGLPIYDPTGFAWFASVLRETTGQEVHNLSIGYSSSQQMTRIVWDGLPLSHRFVTARLANGLWALLPLALSVLFFDRFDPSRRGGRLWRRSRASTPESGEEIAGPAVSTPSTLTLSPVVVRFDPWAPYLAEARLIWASSGILRWVVLAAALVAAAPGEAARAGAAGLLILLAPFLSEASAREKLAGAEDLVFALPLIPRSVALWKAASTAMVVMALGLPMTVRAAAESVTGGFSAVLGLLFLAVWAAGAGLLTGGGKLFTGTLMVIWYGALNGAEFLDFCGTLTGKPSFVRSGTYLLLALSVLAMAEFRQRRTAARGR